MNLGVHFLKSVVFSFDFFKIGANPFPFHIPFGTRRIWSRNEPSVVSTHDAVSFGFVSTTFKCQTSVELTKSAVANRTNVRMAKRQNSNNGSFPRFGSHCVLCTCEHAGVQFLCFLFSTDNLTLLSVTKTCFVHNNRFSATSAVFLNCF